MSGVLLMILNYFHDLAVALLATNIMVVFFLGRYLDRKGADRELMPQLFHRLSQVTWGALAFVIIGGAVRAYYFIDFEWHEAVGRGQIEALVVKHIVLVAVTVFGLVGQFRYGRKYGR